MDASALLALLNTEEGSNLVQEIMSRSAISTINLAELVTRLSILRMPEIEIREAFNVLGLEIIAFDEEQAFRAGLLSVFTRPLVSRLETAHALPWHSLGFCRAHS
jgi:PIN domain nuclease of toxin-antitoxin system